MLITGFRRALAMILPLLFVALFFASNGVSAQNTAELPRVERWREDLKYLAAELPQRHKNLFFKLTREKFEGETAKLYEAIPKLSDAEIKLAFVRLVAMIGDAHTRISYPRNTTYPIALYQFSDGVFVAAATEDHKNLLGAHLVKIGETKLERAKEMIRPLIPYENEAWFKQQFTAYLTDAELLQLLKILPDKDQGSFTFKDRQGKQFSIKLQVISVKEQINLIRPFDAEPDKLPLALRQPELYYWREYLADSKTLYLNYRRCANMPSQPFKKFAAELLKFMDENPIDRLVIDLRYNGGGNSAIFDPFIAALSKRQDVNQTGKLFALIGRGTFSSAYLNALRLKRETKAILAGEPTGQRPNAYGEVKYMTLPHSKLMVSYSTKYFKTMNDDPPSLAPDILVDRSSGDYVAGRDPVLEKVLNYKLKM